MGSHELHPAGAFRGKCVQLGVRHVAGAETKPGITAAQAETDAERVAKETMRQYPAFMASLHIRASVRSLHEETVSQARQLMRTLFLAIFVVLLIACANLAGIASGPGYPGSSPPEIAVRRALGSALRSAAAARRFWRAWY